MDNFYRQVLKDTYGLTYKECSKVQKLMDSENLSIDAAALKVLHEKTKQG